MGTGCPPPVYVRVRRYGWRRREHAWTGGRVHRGPGAIATMMHAAARERSAVRLKAIRHLGQGVFVGPIADRAGRAGCAAATLPRSEPRSIGMGLADPPTVVASCAELHRD